MSDSQQKLTSREDLVTALQFASVLEHTLCCAYLYTGFSMRRSLADFPPPKDEAEKKLFQAALDQSRPWQTQIYFIARQEMEHLAIATNLLAALGEPPYFIRPQFPVPRELTLMDAPFCLDRFSEIAIRTFIWFERPHSLTSSFPADYLDRCKSDGAEVDAALKAGSQPSLRQLHDAVERFDIHSVEELYDQIQMAFQDTSIPSAELFVGDTERQVGDIFGYKVDMKTITNRVEAVQAIDLIIEQGEGTGLDPLDSNSHFQRFTEILREYESFQDKGIDPALPVLGNPLVKKYKGDLSLIDGDCYNCAPHQVQRKSTLKVMQLFNDSYNLMMLMLYDFFDLYVSPNEPATRESAEQAAKYYAAFFPMMTMVIRPLGELLCRIPAGEAYAGQNAGASFEIDNKLMRKWGHVDETTRLRFYRKKLGRLARMANRLSTQADEVLAPNGDQVVVSKEEFVRKMNYLYENLHSTRLHFKNIWKDKY